MITDTLRKTLTVTEPDDLQNQDKIRSANIHTGIILFLGVGFCIAQKINYCTVFAVCYFEKEIVVEAALQSKEDFGNARRVKRYPNMRQVNLIEILLLHGKRQNDATL